MPIIIPVMQRQGMNRGAFGSALTCPGIVEGPNGTTSICMANKWKFVEKLGLYRARYKCKVCGRTIQYDYSANPDHPYAVFGKNKWQRLVEQWKGTHPKGIYP